MREEGWWFALSNKNPIQDEYEFLKELGKGSTSVVNLARHKASGKEYAVKTVEKTKEKKFPAYEINILLTVSHPNIIRLNSIYESTSSIYLVLEYVSGGELFDSIVSRGFYSEKDAAHVVRQLLTAVLYLHSKGIVHRDLKPENLLYSDTTKDQVLKVADFGLSRINKGELLRTICGTPGYVAPEVLLGHSYDEQVDVWAVGVITYILLCGYEPFYDERGDQAMFRKILRGEFTFNSPNWDNVSLNAKDLVRRMLALDPKKRITAREAYSHCWVKGQAANKQHMEETVDQMRAFNARRRLKAVIDLVATAVHVSNHCNNNNYKQQQQKKAADAAKAIFDDDKRPPNPSSAADDEDDDDDVTRRHEVGSAAGYDSDEEGDERRAASSVGGFVRSPREEHDSDEEPDRLYQGDKV